MTGLGPAAKSLGGGVALAATAPVLHLDEAVKSALAHQPTVREARAQTEMAAGRVEQARSGYLPQITGQARYQRAHGTTTVSTGTGAAAGPATAVGTRGVTYDLFSAGVSATQLIWDFGQTIDKTRAASASREAQESAERTARFLVVLQVRQTFFQAHAERALVRVGEDAVANQERHLAQIQGFVDQGIRPEIDLAQAKTDLANSRVTLINARSGYATAKAQLNTAMGVVGSSDYDVADEDIGPVAGEDGPADRLAEAALLARPELAQLQRQRTAAELTLSSINGGYGPNLAAFGGVSEAGPSLDTLGLNWNVGVGLTWPLFQGGLTRGQAREARGNVELTNAQISGEELNVRLQIEQGVLGVSSAKVVIAAARDAVTNARERLRLAEGRYESGVGSIIELDDAELAAASAGAQLVQAEYNLATARADLLTALGR